MSVRKHLKKKIVKKLAGGGGVKGRLEKEFTEDVKLSGGGYVMEDVLKKENYPKKAHGGHIKLGKGVKARKKFLDSIGHKPFKHFEDKAEKDYKEGQTGYKNIKKQQSSSVPGFDFGISAAVMTAAAMAKAEKDKQDAARKQKAQQISSGEQAAAGELATTGKGIMKEDTSLHEGGSVKKYKKELKSEIKGMGPEGKAYLRDKFKDKKYEGKLKGKYKEDLDKELYGMHKKGKKYMKNLLDQYDREGYKGQAHKLREALKKKKAKEDLKKKFAGKKSLHAKGNKMDIHSLGEIIESKPLKKKLREKEGVPKKDIVGAAKGGWIQGAVKKPGALRAVAKKDKLIKGDEKLSASDLNKLGAKAKKSGNSLLAKRVSLAKTFAKMRKK
jgi:hypothetical protein